MRRSVEAFFLLALLLAVSCNSRDSEKNDTSRPQHLGGPAAGQRTDADNEVAPGGLQASSRYDFSWLGELRHNLDQQFVLDPRFNKLLSAAVPDLKMENGQTFRDVLMLNLYLPEKIDFIGDRYVVLAGCRPHDCGEKGLVWVDLATRRSIVLAKPTTFVHPSVSDSHGEAQFDDVIAVGSTTFEAADVPREFWQVASVFPDTRVMFAGPSAHWQEIEVPGGRERSSDASVSTGDTDVIVSPTYIETKVNEARSGALDYEFAAFMVQAAEKALSKGVSSATSGWLLLSARDKYEVALRLYEAGRANPLYIAVTAIHLGVVEMHLDNLDRARALEIRGASMLEAAGLRSSSREIETEYVIGLGWLARICRQQNDQQPAREALAKALKFARDNLGENSAEFKALQQTAKVIE